MYLYVGSLLHCSTWLITVWLALSDYSVTPYNFIILEHAAWLWTQTSYLDLSGNKPKPFWLVSGHCHK
jgi:hypothetical protein